MMIEKDDGLWLVSFYFKEQVIKEFEGELRKWIDHMASIKIMKPPIESSDKTLILRLTKNKCAINETELEPAGGNVFNQEPIDQAAKELVRQLFYDLTEKNYE